jgi:alpha-ketoglutarate-dependent taurine dioxygenase
MIDVVECSFSDIIRDSKYFAEKFLEEGVYGFRGLFASEEEQIDIILAIGDYVGWTPRSDDFDRSVLRRYSEDHSHTFCYGEHTPNDFAVNWHLEHVHSSLENSTVAGFWNMQKFSCSADVGKTYFTDNSKIIDTLSSEVVDFLRKCVIGSKVVVDNKGNVTTKVARDAIVKHPFKNADVVRICQSDVDLISFNGGKPSNDETNFFVKCVDVVETEIVLNPYNQLVWSWQNGDLLVSDLFVMSHAVSGGFKRDERQFLGYFCSHPEIDTSYLYK